MSRKCGCPEDGFAVSFYLGNSFQTVCMRSLKEERSHSSLNLKKFPLVGGYLIMFCFELALSALRTLRILRRPLHILSISNLARVSSVASCKALKALTFKLWYYKHATCLIWFL